MEAWNVIYAFILMLLSVGCIGCNIMIFVAVAFNKNLRKPVNYCVLSLATSDLMVGLFNIPLTAASAIQPDLRAYGVTCNIFGYLEMLFLVSSVQSLCLISISRYLYVTSWNRHKAVFTPARIVLMVMFTWGVSLLICLPPLIGWSRFKYDTDKAHCFVDWGYDESYTYFCIVSCFLTPIFVMSICYWRIFSMQSKLEKKIAQNSNKNSGKEVTPSKKHLVKQPTVDASANNSVFETSSSLPGKKDNEPKQIVRAMTSSNMAPQYMAMKKSERGITTVCFVMVLAFMFCWLPFVITMLMDFYGGGTAAPESIDKLSLFIGYSNSLFNPIIYGYRNNNIRRTYLRLIRRCCCCVKGSPVTSRSQTVSRL